MSEERVKNNYEDKEDLQEKATQTNREAPA